jgi:enoyl-CoA hydratase
MASKDKKSVYEYIITQEHGAVAVITLNRPQTMNALSSEMIADVHHALTYYEKTPHIRALVLTGSDRVFAAGADIKEIKDKTFIDVVQEKLINSWEEAIHCTSKPIIAAIAGYALGGGCEIALMCDMIIAADNAKFGQPEVGLGTIPGAGATQRLPRLIGRAKAMDMCLTGKLMSAQEAEAAGLVSRVLPLENFLDEVIKIGNHIAKMSPMSVRLVKESINMAEDTTLHEGLRFERRLFHATFGTPDQREGMSAFVEKRPPKFR